MTRWRLAALAAATSLTLGLSACGGGDDSGKASPSPAGSSATSSEASSGTSSTATESTESGGTAPSTTGTSTPTLPAPSSTTAATPAFVKAVARGMFEQASNAPTWSMTRKQSRCVARGLVTSLGTDRLVQLGLSQAATPPAGSPSPATGAPAAPSSTAAPGIAQWGLSEAETGAFVDALTSCGVITKDRLIKSTQSAMGQDAQDPTLAACLKKTIDDDMLRALTIDQFMGHGQDGASFKQYQKELLACVS